MKTITWILNLMNKKSPPFTPGPYELNVDLKNDYVVVQTSGRRKKMENNGGYIIAEFHGPDRINNGKLMLCAPRMMSGILSLLEDERKNEKAGLKILNQTQMDMLLESISADSE